jgi:cyclic-di-GMP phosphodiesterase TipF (flagellum assembly factor)
VGEGYLLGVAILTFGALLHYSLARARILAGGADPFVVLNGLSAARIGLPAGAEPARGPEVDKMVAEVKVLQSLVEQLYANRAGAAEKAAQAGAALAAPRPTDSAAERAARPLAVPSGDKAAPLPVLVAPSVAPSVAQAGASPPRAPSVPGPAAGPVALAIPSPAPESLAGEADLEVLRESLRKGQVELALQPIVSLPQRKRRFYESFSRIRVGDGLFLMPQQYIALAERAGLITAIDNTLLFRCIQLLRKTRERDLEIGFFCNISQHTLADRGFFRDFVRYMRANAELASSIIFEFPQRAAVMPDDNLARDLDELHRLGFRFSLDQVSDLDLDADRLSDRGFRFVKIEAARLLARENGINPAALKRRLDARGIDLIVEKIEAETTLVELLDVNIDFGQGYLFGEPRLSRPEG